MKKLLIVVCLLFGISHLYSQNYYSVSVVQPPSLETNAVTDVSTCFYDSIQIGDPNLATGGLPPYVYAWFPTYGLSDTAISNPMALPDDTTTYTITVTDQNNCTSWLQITVNIDPCAGIIKLSNSFEFNVYPNPNNTGLFNISIAGKKLYADYDLRVYSIYGQELYQQKITADDKLWSGSIDLSNIAGKGMYILEISNKHIKNYQKIIIH